MTASGERLGAANLSRKGGGSHRVGHCAMDRGGVRAALLAIAQRAGEISPRPRRDLAGVWPRFRRDLAEIWPRSSCTPRRCAAAPSLRHTRACRLRPPASRCAIRALGRAAAAPGACGVQTATIEAGVRPRATSSVLVASHEYEGSVASHEHAGRSAVEYGGGRVLSSAGGWRTGLRLPLLGSGASRAPPAVEAEAGRATSLRHGPHGPPRLGETVLRRVFTAQS